MQQSPQRETGDCPLTAKAKLCYEIHACQAGRTSRLNLPSANPVQFVLTVAAFRQSLRVELMGREIGSIRLLGAAPQRAPNAARTFSCIASYRKFFS